MVPFWAVKDFKPNPEEFLLRVPGYRIIAVLSLRLDKTEDVVGKRFSIRVRKKRLLPAHYHVKKVFVTIRIREKVVGSKRRNVLVIARWEDIKPEFIKGRDWIPIITGRVIRSEP